MFVPGMYSYTVCDAHSVIRCALFTREGGNGTGIARVNLIDCLDLSWGATVAQHGIVLGGGNITLVSIENGISRNGFPVFNDPRVSYFLLACLFVRLFVGMTVQGRKDPLIV